MQPPELGASSGDGSDRLLMDVHTGELWQTSPCEPRLSDGPGASVALSTKRDLRHINELEQRDMEKEAGAIRRKYEAD